MRICLRADAKFCTAVSAKSCATSSQLSLRRNQNWSHTISAKQG